MCVGVVFMSLKIHGMLKASLVEEVLWNIMPYEHLLHDDSNESY